MQMNTQSLTRSLVFIVLLAALVIGGAAGFYWYGQSAVAARAAAATTYYVTLSGADSPTAGTSATAPYRTLQYALDRVPCGSTILLADGIYADDTRVNRPDCTAHPFPFVVSGATGAVMVGAGNTYIIEVLTGNITFNGFSIDGAFTPGDYRKKLVYVNAEGVSRLTLDGMTLRNAREECLRLRLGATHNVIIGNRFEQCGREGGGTTGDNREAIYLGSTASQLENDRTAYNWVIGNTFNLGLPEGIGSECIDVKGSAHHNLIEGNQCYFQSSDPESGGINIEGVENLVINNRVEGNAGNGIRLGLGQATTPRLNRIIGNILRDNRGFGINAVYELTPDEVLLIRDNCIEDNGEGDVNRDLLEDADGGVCSP
jgi:hypothetical protein